MKCPICAHKDSSVVDSRTNNICVRRRRECTLCKTRFTTSESIVGNILTAEARKNKAEHASRMRTSLAKLKI